MRVYGAVSKDGDPSGAWACSVASARGRFIHHRPSGPGEAVSEQQAIGVTIAAMRGASLLIDPALWVPQAACSQCYQGCSDDPKGV